MLDKEDLLATAKHIIKGYVAHRPLEDREQRLLHTLTMSRLAQSVIMSAYSFSKDPTNEYLLVTAKPGWRALEQLLAMDEPTIAKFNGLGGPECS